MESQASAGEFTEGESLPIIDVSGLCANVDGAITEVARQIDLAARNWGFFYIVGHPFNKERMQEVVARAKEFFDLPLEEKLKNDIRENKFHRGYGCLDAEQLDPSKPLDHKETFNIGFHLPLDHPCVAAGRPLRGPNTYPTALPGWREFMDNHYAEMQQFALLLLRCIAHALQIKPDFFDERFHEPLSVLRLLHYPPLESGESMRLVCGEHTDYGIITLLYQDNAGGLQVRKLSGEWMDVQPIEGSFVVNIGDMMNMWSNGRYRSTPHRVRHGNAERYSIPFFMEPNPYVLLECLDNCHSPENPPKYPPVTVVDWMLSRFAATYAHRNTEM